MTVSEFIFDFIQKIGCKTVYMVSGSSAMWLTDALKRNERLEAICCHHEQAAAMAADGYGRINNVPGTCLVTIGPGAMNSITGVAQAYVDSSPMFVISGQANSRLHQYQIDTKIRQHGCQSINLEPIVTPITKYFAAVMKPEEIRYHMEKAYYEAMNGRKGPVWIDVPVDIQNKQVPEKMKGYTVLEEENILPDEEVNIIADLILKAKKPLILAGFGVRSGNAVEELDDLSKKYKIPVVTSRGGIDIIESENPLFIGRPGSYGDRASHFALQNCDLLLILGSRLSVSTIGYYPDRFAHKAIKVMVDIDEKELQKTDVNVNYKIKSNIKEFLRILVSKLKKEQLVSDNIEWLKYCNEMKDKYPNVKQEYENESPLNSYYFTKLLSDMIKDNASIVVDTGSVCNIVSQTWNIKKGQRYLISGGLSCMGFWATAIGLCKSSNHNSVIALTGDGSAQMNIQELATIHYNKLPVKLFIYNNNGYMLIRHNQHNYMNDRFLGVGPDSGLQTPDFIKVSNAYGIKAVRITKEDNIIQKLEEVISYDGPVVCEVIVQEFAPIVPRIASRVMPDGSLKAAEFDDLYPFLDENEE
jgi:acetolactate synthase-1/2/3 large subunit